MHTCTCKCIITHKTVEAFWVPCEAQGGDEALHDGPLAAVALWRKLLVVVLPAVRLPVLLVEPLVTEMLTTQRAEEMLRMPRLPQGIHTTLEEINRMVISIKLTT